MPSKPTDASALSITLTEDGTATLTGINYQDLRSILTAASLHNYDAKPNIRRLDGSMDDVVHANNVDDAVWRLWQRTLLDILSAHMAEAIRPGYSDGLPAAKRALSGYKLRLKTIDEDVRELEKKVAEEPKPPVDSFKVFEGEFARAVQALNGTFAKYARERGE